MTSVFDQPRPSWKWCDVSTTLADFAIITYAVTPDALSKLLPPEFEPDLFQLADGSTRAFISAVPFRDLDFRFEGLPWARFCFGQTNYRAYVKYRGTRCVWFFGTSLATVFVGIPRHLWKLPWHHAQMKFKTRWHGDLCESYTLSTTGAWGNASIELIGTDESTGRLDGFADAEETAAVLTHPLDGYFYRRDGRIGTYSVWHDRLQLKRALVKEARFEVFEQLGLIDRTAKPHSALVQQKTEFFIVLPPQPLANKSG
jgi:uncharacterized protein YqjF (DUF2071 family)